MDIKKLLTPITIKAMILIGISLASFSIANIYSNSLFLSSYPPSWSAYYLIAQTVVNSIITAILTPLLLKNVKRNSILLLFICITIYLTSFCLSFRSLQWIPFINAILIGITSVIFVSVGWNLMSLAYGLREYKNIVIYLNLASNVGGILGSLMVTSTLKHFSLESLLGILIVFMLINIFILMNFSLIQQPSHRKVVETSLLRLPLYTNFLLFIVGLLVGQGFIDYMFKYQLSNGFSKNEMAIFMGYFNTVVSVLGLVSALSITKNFLRHFHIPGLLYITPIIFFITALVAIIHPTFWSVCILASIKQIFYNNHTRLSIEVVLNILPSAIRIACKSQLKSIVNTSASLGAYILLLAIASYVHTRELAILIAILAIMSLYYGIRVNAKYKSTLQQEIEFRRFNLVDKINPATSLSFKKALIQVLHTENMGLILFSLHLLNRIKLTTIPPIIYTHLNNDNLMIRKAAIKIIRNNEDKNALNYLVERFKIEEDVETKFNLLDTLSTLRFESAITIANEYINSPTHSLYPAALGIFLSLSPQKQLIIKEFARIAQSKESLIRKEVAYLIGKFQIKELFNELILLLKDTDLKVSKIAIKSVAKCKLFSLAPAIIHQLNCRRNVHTAHYALVNLGKKIIPALTHQISKANDNYLLVQVLAEIPEVEGENALIQLAYQGSIYFKSIIAKEASLRATHLPISDTFKHKAKQFVIEELNYIGYLNQLLNQYSQPFKITEILSRLKLAKKSLLYWIAIFTDAKQVHRLIPCLFNSSGVAQQDLIEAKAKALELLELSISDLFLKNIIVELLEYEKIEYNYDKNNHYDDTWLDKVIHFEEIKDMESINHLLKVFDLREIELFKELPSEILVAIADETKEVNIKEGALIFKENAIADGLYCIRTGSVKIMRQNQTLNILPENTFFGEMALIDDAPRAASAYANSDCALLFLEKGTFDRITNDNPEILRVVVKVILSYLRKDNPFPTLP